VLKGKLEDPMYLKRIIAFSLAAALGACRFAGTPLRMEGEPTALAALAGEWDGQYWENHGDRHGMISFMLKAGTDSAFGDVIMSSPFGEPLIAADPERHMNHAQTPRVLHVDFVRVDGNYVRGALEEYISPDCSCAVSTVFRGAMHADTLSGTYLTTLPGGSTREGQWRMLRRGEDSQ
jgi:hypothetical protein